MVLAANSLIERDGEPLLVQLPRTPGRKDAEYMHLFGGPVDVEAHASKAQESRGASAGSRSSVADLTARIEALEAEVQRLRRLVEPDVN